MLEYGAATRKIYPKFRSAFAVIIHIIFFTSLICTLRYSFPSKSWHIRNLKSKPWHQDRDSLLRADRQGLMSITAIKSCNRINTSLVLRNIFTSSELQHKSRLVDSASPYLKLKSRTYACTPTPPASSKGILASPPLYFRALQCLVYRALLLGKYLNMTFSELRKRNNDTLVFCDYRLVGGSSVHHIMKFLEYCI